MATIKHVATAAKRNSRLQTGRFKNDLEKNVIVTIERLNDSVVKIYQDRAEERNENIFFEKYKKAKKLILLPAMDVTGNFSNKEGIEDIDIEYLEKIEDFKFEFGKEMFYIKWKDFNDSYNTWEPIEKFDNCPDILYEFVSKEELKHYDKIEKLKEDISFDDLLSEQNLISRFNEVDEVILTKLKASLLIKLLSIIHLTGREEELRESNLIKDARNALQLYVTTRRRCRQMMIIQDWEYNLNQSDVCKKLCVENKVDFTGPPENFTYINISIVGAGVIISNDPPNGCKCVLCNYRCKCCYGKQDSLFAYTVKRRLRIALGTPIFECSKACKCSSDCNNRVVQKGRDVKLTIFRTSNGRGWGVRADENIKQGQFLCQYVGEIISNDEAKKRETEYNANAYMFDLDFNSFENPYVIDASNMGNVSHFFNHSCDPNCGVWAVWSGSLDPKLPMLALFTKRDIEAGEEVCIDYEQKCNGRNDDDDLIRYSFPDETIEGDDASVPSGSEANTATSSVSPTQSLIEPQTNTTLLKNRIVCKCGTAKCRKYVF